MIRRTVLLLTAALTTLLVIDSAWAQGAYPDRLIRIILPYAAGVSPDVVARLLAERLSPALGKPVIVDNRPGAGGMLGAEVAATLPPDGYNLLFTVKGVMAIVPHVYPSAKFNPLKDFKAVTEILQVPHIIVATNKAPFNDMKGLVDYAKKNPGKLNYASNGTGSHPHVGMETVMRRLDLQVVTCPTRACRGRTSSPAWSTFSSRRRRPRFRTSRPAGSRRSPLRARSASRRCPSCRRSPSSAPTSTRMARRAIPGTASSPRPGRRMRSSRG